MVKRVVSFVAWFLALAALILSAAPAAIAQDDPRPLDQPGNGGFGLPGGDFEYPQEWDPTTNTDVISADYLFAPGSGFVINVETRDIFDPVEAIVVRADGTFEDYATGAVLFVDPLAANPPLPSELGIDVPRSPGTEAAGDPADPDSTEATADPEGNTDDADSVEAVGGGALPSEFEESDPVLALYRTGFTAADLDPYALGIDELSDAALDDSFQFLAYEIALLVEAGAFSRETAWFDTFADLHAQFDFDDAPTRELVRTFGAVDREFARRQLLYRDAIDPVEDWAVDWAIGELDDPFYDMLIDGDRGFINGHEYAAALLRVMAGGPDIELTSNSGAENVQLEVALAAAVEALELQQDITDMLRADNDELRALLADLTEPSIAAALAVLDAPEGAAPEPENADDPTMIFAAAGGGAALLLIVAFVALRRGRRKAARTDHAGLRDEAMATNQLLAGAKNEAEIIAILDRAADRQVKAALVLFHAVPEGLRRAGESAILTGSDLHRVVASGQMVKATLHDDPAFPGSTQAVLAVPVINNGTVQAVLAAHRDASSPLGEAERTAMEPIAPALGGALERSAELGTMSKLAMVDGLTSLGNRRRLDDDLASSLASATATSSMLGFAMIDVDHFKTYNDTHGHSAGDEVLRRVAATIARSVRETDVVYRYGGEEFSMLLPGATPEEAAAVAERVRSSVEAEAIPGEELQPGGRLTVSIGVATLESGSGGDIRERADDALYRAKERGRNQVAYA